MKEFELISDIKRRMANMINLGVIHSVDAALCRVAIGGDAQNLTPPIKWQAGRAANETNWSQPDIGEQVLLLSPSGDIGNAVAVLGFYSTANPAPSNNPDLTLKKMPDGAVFSYNHADSILQINLPSGGTTEIITDGGLHIVGDTEIDGNVLVNGSIHSTDSITTDADIAADGDIHADGDVSDATRSMAEDREIYNTHTHPAGVPDTGTPSALQ